MADQPMPPRLWFLVLVVQHAVTQTREGKNPDHGKDGKRHATSVETHWPRRRHYHPPCGLPLSTSVILDTGRYGYPMPREPQTTLGGSLPHPRRVSWHPRHTCNSMAILCVLDAATGNVIIDAISVHPSWKGFNSYQRAGNVRHHTQAHVCMEAIGKATCNSSTRDRFFRSRSYKRRIRRNT